VSTQSKNASVVFVGTYTEFEGSESEGIYVYRMDLENGKLHKKAEVDVQPGAGPRHLTFHPNGQFAYLVNELNSTLISYRDDTENGTFEELQTVPALPQDFKDENLCGDIHISTNGKYLYASNRGYDSIVCFS
jgi:6-phosphogluconolactonase